MKRGRLIFIGIFLIGCSLTAQSIEKREDPLLGKWVLKKVLFRAQGRQYVNGHYENMRMFGHAINIGKDDHFNFLNDSILDLKLSSLKFRMTAKYGQYKETGVKKLPISSIMGCGTWSRKEDVLLLNNPSGVVLKFEIKKLNVEKLILAIVRSSNAKETGRNLRMRFSFIFNRDD